MKVMRVPDNTVIADHVDVARTLRSRITGLLGRAGLQRGEGLVLPRCNSIHTIGMRFAIDVIFVDRAWHVVALRRNVGPGQVLWPVLGASSVIELSAGVLEGINIERGHQLKLAA